MTARPRADRGSVTTFTLLICLGMVALLGLVAEGGDVLAAREQAVALAEQAARAGAAQLSPTTLHLGGVLDQGGNPVLAAEYLLAVGGHPGYATVTGNTVTATVRPYAVSTPLLRIVGVPSIAVGATASATAVAG